MQECSMLYVIAMMFYSFIHSFHRQLYSSQQLAPPQRRAPHSPVKGAVRRGTSRSCSLRCCSRWCPPFASSSWRFLKIEKIIFLQKFWRLQVFDHNFYKMEKISNFHISFDSSWKALSNDTKLDKIQCLNFNLSQLKSEKIGIIRFLRIGPD